MGEIMLFGSTTTVSLSMLMLASLLLNAGLGVKLGKVGRCSVGRHSSELAWWRT